MATSVPKPSHLSAAYGAWFRDPLVAEAYPMRPPYPQEVITLLASLVPEESLQAGRLLDLGAGTGDLARRLAPLAARVDAVDASEAMMEIGKALPGGDHPNIRWILGLAEEAPLEPPYALATAGESLHWMDWDVVLPRVARAFVRGAVLATVTRSWESPRTLHERLIPIFERYSPVKDYRPFDVIAEITSRGLFAEVGRQRCGPTPWTPTIEEYVECRHSQRGFSRTHMGPEATAGFDAAVIRVLEDSIRDGTIAERNGRLQLSVTSGVTWGRPLMGPAAS